MDEQIDGEQAGIRPPYESQRAAILLVDCHEEMFADNAFKMVIEACFLYFDKLLSNRSGKNSLIILLAHREKAKQVLISDTINALEAYRLLHKMLQMSNEDLKAEYASNDEQFNEHLFNALKSKQRAYDMILYATKRSNPCVDNTDNHLTMLRFDDLKITKTKFKVLALCDTLDFSAFFDEVYHKLEQKTFHYYYQLQNLAEEIADSIHYKEFVRSMNIYPYAGCKFPLRVEIYSVRRKSTRPPTVRIHKETLEILEKRAVPTEHPPGFQYFVPLTIGTTKKMQITEEQYKTIGQIEGIEMGITLIEARPQKSGAYSRNGVSCHQLELLRATKTTTAIFDEFWEAMKDLHLLGICKFTRAGCAYHVELTPVQIRSEKYFEMCFIPPMTMMHISMRMDPYVTWEIPDASALKQFELPQMDDLIEACSIEDFPALMANLCKPETAKANEYAKKQLLGNAYIPKEIQPYREVHWYKGTPETIDAICAAMEDGSIQEAAGTKRKRK